MEELSSGELLLKEIMQGLIISKDWANVKKKVADHLFVYSTAGFKAATKVPKIDAISHSLRYQLVLEVVGPDMRELWGEAHEQAYKPELLREPYLTTAARRDLLEALSTFFTVKINELVGEGEQSSKQMQDLQLTKQQYFVTTKIRAQILLQHNKDTKTPAQLQEDIGSALTTLLRKEDLLVHLLATPMTPQSAYDPRKDDRKGDQYKSGLAVMQLTAEDQGSQAVRDTLELSDQEKLNNLCLQLRGAMLSSSMRSDLWGYCYLTRQPYEAPNPKGLTLVRELPRLTQDKGFDVSSKRGLERSSMFSMISNAVDAGIAAALPLSVSTLRDAVHKDVSRPNSAQPSWMKRSDEQREKTKLGHLASRARFMVHALYALNDEFNSRVVMVAILLLWNFPNEPPTGEKILRIYQRIALECLPSEQLQHEYSLATVAYDAWALLLVRDPELAHFLQNYDVYRHSRDLKRAQREALKNADSVGTGSSDDESDKLDKSKQINPPQGKGANVGLSKTTMDPNAMEVPRSFLLLRGWLEDGFLGWLGEYTVLYIWDQLMLFGAHPAIFKEILPVFSCILLRAMRVSLLSLPVGKDLIESLRTFGRKLRTRNIVEALRCDPLCAKFAPPPQEDPRNMRSGPNATAGDDAEVPENLKRDSVIMGSVPLAQSVAEEKDVMLSTAVSALSMGSAGESPQETPFGGQTHFSGLDLAGLSTQATSRPASAGNEAGVPRMAELGPSLGSKTNSVSLDGGGVASQIQEIAGAEEGKAGDGSVEGGAEAATGTETAAGGASVASKSSMGSGSSKSSYSSYSSRSMAQ